MTLLWGWKNALQGLTPNIFHFFVLFLYTHNQISKILPFHAIKS
ncbi:hypothetical protein L289_4100 [Acinetobacter gerneri DSM 14967 = CIP 107464 = MTCC 9824]|nr:hypothetical protein L289_4100 [Acinetobacter gerneri DSM 14967 = CIP 107464 = MTCC 9824]